MQTLWIYVLVACALTLDYEDFQKTEELESMASELTGVFPAGNKLLLVNPDCFIGIILDYVFDTAGIDEDLRSAFDLSTAKGKLLNVHAYAPNENALEIFIEGATYYIVYCDKQPERVRPLLNISTKEYSSFIENQKRRSTMTRVRSQSKASRHSLMKGRQSSKSLKSSQSKSKPQI